MTKIISPLSVFIPRSRSKAKEYVININTYRNAHYQLNNQAKYVYTQNMMPQLHWLRFRVIKISYVLYKKNKRADRANILSIIDKFFCDALIKNKCIENDTDDIIISQSFRSGGIDKENPRCEILIEEVG